MKKMKLLLRALCIMVCVLVSLTCLFACANRGQGNTPPAHNGEQNQPGGGGDNTDTPPIVDDDDPSNPGGDDPDDPDDPDTPQPDEKTYTDLFIFMGQSNMSGQGNAKESIVCEQGHGYEFRAVSGNDQDGWLYPVKEPFGSTESNDSIKDYRTGGLVSSFMESYYQTTGRAAVGVSASISGSSITQWLPGQAAYQEAVARLNACIGYVSQHTELTINSINMVWCQGESDGYSTAHAGFDYAGNLKKLFNGMHDDAQVETCFIITPSIYSNNLLNEDKVKVVDVQVKLCQESENFVLVARKFEGAPMRFRDDPHFYQGVYNVCGWEAGANTGKFILDGTESECKIYQDGDAEELAEQFDIKLTYNQNGLDEEVYELQRKNSGQTAANPGVWTYYSPDDEKLNSAPTYDHGTVTIDIASKVKADQYYVRYQPNFAKDTKYTLKLTVKLDTVDPDPYLVFGVEGYSSKYYDKITNNADGSFTLTYAGTVGDTPFYIRVNTSSETISYAIKMTLTNIECTAEQTQPNPGDEGVYQLANGGNAVTVATPGKWTYWTSGAANFNEMPTYNNGVVTVDIASRIKSDTYRISYQPDLAVGTQYTLKFTIKFETTDDTVYFTFGKEYYSSKFYTNIKTNADGSFTVTYNGTVDATTPFLIQVATGNETDSVAVKMTVYDISIV